MAEDRGRAGETRPGRLHARARRRARERRARSEPSWPLEPVRGWEDTWAPETTRGEARAGRGHVGSDDFRDLERFGTGTGIRTTRPGARMTRKE